MTTLPRFLSSPLVALLAILTFHSARADCIGDHAAIVAEHDKNIDATMEKMAAGAKKGAYKPDWKSLEKHDEAPDWFRDGKIGIYFHWGVYAVPAHGNEWYPKWMHTKEGRRSYYQHHKETYGEPSEFGYHDFVPKFTAEKFDADEWADLFVKTGARWAGPVCEHHDGFSMWDSAITPWNARDMGPKRDITGELEKAIKARGMKFVTTFHHERTRDWYPRVEGWPTTSDDPLLQMLYMNIEADRFHRIFQTKLGEVIDRYQPDLIWFDGQMQHIPDPYHRTFLAYYFNRAAEWGGEPMVTTKKLQYPQEVSVLDFEKGRANALTPWPWLNDDTISTGSWCFTDTLKVKPAVQVIHDFIDAVSKNGQLLLNISPKADGTIPQDQRDCLAGIGEWLKVNGEAIYETRPWLEYGEGPNKLKKSGSFTGSIQYTDKDIRYTRSKDGKTVHALALGWPESGEISPEILQVDKADGGKVELLGHKGPLEFEVADKLLTIQVPKKAPCEHAYAFKLSGFETSLTPAAAKAREEALEKLKSGPVDPHKMKAKKGKKK